LVISIETYITMAEIRYLEGRMFSSIEYFNECKNLMNTFFMDENDFLISKNTPPNFLFLILNIFKRLIRILFCYPGEVIRSNLILIDSFIKLEIETEQNIKKNENSSELSEEEIEKLKNNNKFYESLYLQLKNKKIPFFDQHYNKDKKKFYFERKSIFKKNLIGKSFFLSERVTERLWSCIFRIKENIKKYKKKEITEKILRYENKESIKRLYILMFYIRNKKIISKSSSLSNKLRDDSIKSNSSDQFRLNRTSSDASSMKKKKIAEEVVINNDEYLKTRSYKFIDEKISKLSLLSGDLYLLNTFLEDNSKIHDNNFEGNFEMKIYTPSKYIYETKLFGDVLYLLKIYDELIYYKPNENKIIIQKFGGREEENKFNLKIDKDSKSVYISNQFLSDLQNLILNTDSKKNEKNLSFKEESIFKIFKNEKIEKIEGEEVNEYIKLFQNCKKKNYTSNNKYKFKNLTDITFEIPTNLITSHFLCLFPWELILEKNINRYFTLQDLFLKKEMSEKQYFPYYFTFYSQDDKKIISNCEKLRKDWIYSYFLKNMNFTNFTTNIFHNYLTNLPLHTPLVNYSSKPTDFKEYKLLDYVKLSVVSQNPTQIITYLDSILLSNQFPIFLFTLNDLFDINETILCLLSYRPDCTFFFIPDSYIQQTTKFLLELQSVFVKLGYLPSKNTSNTKIYKKFLSFCLFLLQKVFKVPIVSMNSPFDF
jgi:hypothetical protein